MISRSESGRETAHGRPVTHADVQIAFQVTETDGTGKRRHLLRNNEKFVTTSDRTFGYILKTGYSSTRFSNYFADANYSMPGPVSSWMGDRLSTGKPSRYVTSHPGQFSLAIPPWVGAICTSESWGVNGHTARYTGHGLAVSSWCLDEG